MIDEKIKKNLNQCEHMLRSRQAETLWRLVAKQTEAISNGCPPSEAANHLSRYAKYQDCWNDAELMDN